MKNNLHIYMVEVGIELENTDKEFEAYKVELNGKVKNWKSLYNENVIAFLDKQEAKDYVDKYVKEGVKNTYGFVWEVEREVEDVNLEELFKMYYLEDCYYAQQKILYFKGGQRIMRNDRQEFQARFKELYPKKRLLAVQLNGFNHTVFFDNHDGKIKVERFSPYREVRGQTPQSEALFDGYPTYAYQGQPKEIIYVGKEDL